MDTKFKPIDKADENLCHMTVADWLDSVAIGLFIDYDGYGEWATETEVGNLTVAPSDVYREEFSVPTWATHVVWYNR